MLAAFFRGAFLIGILAWYSISVWNMIDGYFRDQFTSYLHEEYRKNPHMKTYMKDVNEVGKNEAVHTDRKVPLKKIDELEKAESCPVDKVDTDKLLKPCDISEKISEVDRPNESVEKEMLEKISTEKDLYNVDDDDHHQTIKSDEKMADEEKGPKKKEFSSKDFLSVKNRRGTIGRDEDFWEFEDDEEKQKMEDEEKGILISDLPFKPKLDIGRLERITPDEYCPLTLEDELSCGETTKWP
ncbi:hypothetical protein HZH66_008568 [Vespula vulgaris]|uniref:Uncharacterized protein n=1 Tax=Vespula vulgaris TaxID=7454 RepID=A0A834N1U8_VESVU|nr:hypothetical protein HZH66_008568 [Vespula vulgaris]